MNTFVMAAGVRDVVFTPIPEGFGDMISAVFEKVEQSKFIAQSTQFEPEEKKLLYAYRAEQAKKPYKNALGTFLQAVFLCAAIQKNREKLERWQILQLVAANRLFTHTFLTIYAHQARDLMNVAVADKYRKAFAQHCLTNMIGSFSQAYAARLLQSVGWSVLHPPDAEDAAKGVDFYAHVPGDRRLGVVVQVKTMDEKNTFKAEVSYPIGGHYALVSRPGPFREYTLGGKKPKNGMNLYRSCYIYVPRGTELVPQQEDKKLLIEQLTMYPVGVRSYG